MGVCGSEFPAAGGGVVVDGLVVVVDVVVAVVADEYEFGDVGFAFGWGAPGHGVVGFAATVVGAAEDAAFVSNDQCQVLGVGGESCVAAEPEGLAVESEDEADDVDVGSEVFGQDAVGDGAGADHFGCGIGVKAKEFFEGGGDDDDRFGSGGFGCVSLRAV